MCSWIVKILLISFPFFCFGQNSTNPFDVRTDRIEEVTKAQDTVRGNEIVPARLPTTIAKTPVKPSRSFDNPFEVSHIPLRKSQVEKSRSNKTQKINASKTTENYYLPMIVILISCIILGFVLSRDRNILSGLYRSLNNKNFSATFSREKASGLKLGMVLIYLLFFFNAGLFVFLSVKHYRPQQALSYLTIVGILGVIYLGRHFIMNVFLWLFPVKEVIKPYNFTIQVANSLIGLILIPLNLLLAYGPKLMGQSLIYGGLFVILLVLCFRFLTGFTLSNKYRRESLFHFFLYFCSFEMIPLIIGYVSLVNL